VPTTIIVQIFVASHFLGNVLSAAYSVFALVPRQGPPSKVVGIPDFSDVVTESIGPRKRALLTGLQAIRISCAASNFRPSTPHGCYGLIAILVNVQTKFARLIHIECQVWGINLEPVVAIKTTDAEVQ